ncbi:hypothetical protein KSP40_PGU008779 [Platanthera guangdongensis]|uniref:Uncharacterized protein n=1 Tax=Platanthera guangdongensis TaxID=2320717 RepID=A0ABR2LMB2_9ASPA
MAAWNSVYLELTYQVLGWIAFFSWSFSFYPQVILNFKRKSVVGLNFDFLVLNFTKHSSYLIYNAALFFSSEIQRQYHEKYGYDEKIADLQDMGGRSHVQGSMEEKNWRWRHESDMCGATTNARGSWTVAYHLELCHAPLNKKKASSWRITPSKAHLPQSYSSAAPPNWIVLRGSSSTSLPRPFSPWQILASSKAPSCSSAISQRLLHLFLNGKASPPPSPPSYSLTSPSQVLCALEAAPIT